MRLARLFWFHFKLYATNSYFLWVTITGTAAVFLLQYLSAYATHNLNDPTIWIRSGIFGLWSSATTTAGCINFQRMQGTLAYLINGQIDERLSLTVLLLPAASFGLLAFPVAYLLAVVLKVMRTGLSVHLLIGILGIWVGAVVMDLLIAALFVLTPNGMVYEELLTIPLLLLAGLFGNLPALQGVFNFTQWFIPIAAPIHSLLSAVPLNWSATLVSTLSWIAISWQLTSVLLRRARQHGISGVI